ncbi:MAG TPA: TonB family protein [Bryobacteraceae bacterium]|nr:TonB family protein [Bryobacteraceae bacterium]
MHSRADILDQTEPLGKWMLGSVVLHVAVIGAILTAGWFGGRSVRQLGDINGGGFGSVAVSAVSTIPLPTRSGPINPVANDTESRVPEPKPQPKPKPEVKQPEPDAVPIKSRNATKRPSKPAAPPNKFREKQQDLENQVYTPSGQAMVSPMYQRTGGGGVSLGNNSPFGTQCGWYANILRDKVARNWQTGEVDSRVHAAPPVAVIFTIRKDGSVPANSVRVAQRSGIYQLDNSAQRAILDAAPFPALPNQCIQGDAQVEFDFELRR